MSDGKVLPIDNLRRFARSSREDHRSQLLAVKEMAALLLEELNAALDTEASGGVGPNNYLSRLYSGAGVNYYQELRRFEIELIRCALLLAGGKQSAAAQLLGLKPTTLNTKIKQFHIEIKKAGPQSHRPALQSNDDRESSHSS